MASFFVRSNIKKYRFEWIIEFFCFPLKPKLKWKISIFYMFHLKRMDSVTKGKSTIHMFFLQSSCESKGPLMRNQRRYLLSTSMTNEHGTISSSILTNVNMREIFGIIDLKLYEPHECEINISHKCSTFICSDYFLFGAGMSWTS